MTQTAPTSAQQLLESDEYVKALDKDIAELDAATKALDAEVEASTATGDLRQQIAQS